MSSRSFCRLLLAAAVLTAVTPLAGAAPSRRAPGRIANTRRVPLHRLFDPRARPLPTGPILVIKEDGVRFPSPLVAQAEYADLRNATKELLRTFPPEKSYFVGLGRDPTPIVAFLQNLGGDKLAMNFAGASGKDWEQPTSYQGKEWAVFKTYFARHIPKAVWEGTRDIVLMDQTNSGLGVNHGGTLGQFAPLVERYAKERGFKGRILRAAFSATEQPNGTVQIDTAKYPDTARFLGPPYEDAVAEFERHSIRLQLASGKGFVVLPRRPEYAKFKRALKRRMRRDADLHEFVTKELPVIQRGGRRETTPKTPWRPSVTLRFQGAPAKEDALLWLRPGNETFSYLAMPEYEQIGHAVANLMTTQLPRKSFYIGVGRTSAAYVAFLENLGSDVATYLPVDGLEDRDPAIRQQVFQLFDEFLPREALSGERTLVLFEQAKTGASAGLLGELLSEYLQEKGSRAQVSVIVLTSHTYLKPDRQNWQLDTTGMPELELLDTAKYHAVAPYDYFRPGTTNLAELLGTNGKPRPRNKAYDQFKSALRVRMAADDALATRVTALFEGP